MTSGGLDADGTWRQAKKDSLLPYRVLMHMFRGKLLVYLRDALVSGKLTPPINTSLKRSLTLLRRLGRVTWNVRLLERYAHAAGVNVYLAKYLRGGPIGNRRLVSCHGGQVKFRYVDRRDGQAARQASMRLSAEQFLKRWSQHVPPAGMHVVRAYGLYASGNRRQLNQARAQLAQPAYDPQQVTINESPDEAPIPQAVCVCPVCNEPLIIERLPRRSLPVRWQFPQLHRHRACERAPPRTDRWPRAKAG